jgi:hypothetical protein
MPVKIKIPPSSSAPARQVVKMLDMTTSEADDILYQIEDNILYQIKDNMASYIKHLWVDSKDKNIVYIHFNNLVEVKYPKIIRKMKNKLPVPELPDEDTNFKIPDDTPNKEILYKIIGIIIISKKEENMRKKRAEVNNSEQRAILTPKQWEAKLGIAELKTPDMIPLFEKSPCFMILYNSVIKHEPNFLDTHINTIAKIAAILPVDMVKYSELLAEFLSSTTYIQTKLASVFRIEPNALFGYKIPNTHILHELYTVLILSLANINKSITINNIYAVAYLMNQAGRFTFETDTLRSKFFDVIQNILETYESPIHIKYDCHVNSRRSINNIKDVEYTCGRYIEIDADADKNTILIKQTVSMTNNTVMNNTVIKKIKNMEPYAVPAKQCMTGGYGTLNGVRLSSRTLKHLINKSITKTKKRKHSKRKHRTAKRL